MSQPRPDKNRSTNDDLEDHFGRYTDFRCCFQSPHKYASKILPVYVVLMTPDYHVSFANRFFKERFGISDGQRCFECLFHRTEPCEK